MKVIELELRNRVVHLFIRNGGIEKKTKEDKTKSGLYYPLLKYLAEQLTESQLTSLIEPYPKKKDTYYLTQYDIYSCYDSMDIEDNYNTSETHCICGVRIHRNYYIKNCETDEVYTVGSECINNWEIDPRKRERLRNHKKKLAYKRKYNEEAIICNICNKIINKRKCSCNLRDTPAGECFDIWKRITQKRMENIGYYTRIKLGKYKGLTYYELFCVSRDDDYPDLLKEVCNYINWVLTTTFSNTKMNDMKDSLNKYNVNFLKYYSLDHTEITYNKQQIDNIITSNKNENTEVLCKCNKPAAYRFSKTKLNPNRPFYTCKDCGFFKWKNDRIMRDEMGYGDEF